MDTTLQFPKTVLSHRIGGAAFMLGTVLFVVNKLDEMSRLFLGRSMPDVISERDLLLIGIGQLALIIGFVSFYRAYSIRGGRFIRNTIRMISGGGIFLSIGHITFMSQYSLVNYLPGSILRYKDYMFAPLILGLAVMLLGLILFGIRNLREPMLGRWQWLPLATGVMGFIGFFWFSGEDITATFLFFRTLFAMGLIGLGFILWLEKPSQPNNEFPTVSSRRPVADGSSPRIY